MAAGCGAGIGTRASLYFFIDFSLLLYLFSRFALLVFSSVLCCVLFGALSTSLWCSIVFFLFLGHFCIYVPLLSLCFSIAFPVVSIVFSMCFYCSLFASIVYALLS